MTTASPSRRLVLADLLPGERIRDVALVIGSAVFLCALAQVSIHLPFTPVPLTLSTLAVLLIGATLGPVRGALGLALYVVAGMAGVPWFADHHSGWQFASFGYLIGFVVAGIIVGQAARAGGDRSVARALGLMALGSLTIYAVGVPWLMVYLDVDLGRALAWGVTPFLIGDVIKAVVAAVLLPTAWEDDRAQTVADDTPSTRSRLRPS